MTAAETIEAFQNYIDQFSTARSGNDDFWINEAIESFIKQRLNVSSPLPNGGFQITQRVRDDLSKVVKIDEPVSYSNGIVTVPDTVYEIIPSSLGLQNSQTIHQENKYIYARPRAWDWYYSNRSNPFTKPILKEGRAIYLESDLGLKVFPAIEYDKVILSFIKKWEKFSLEDNVEIPLKDKTHQEITRLAAFKYLVSVGNMEGAKDLLQQNIME